jgi:hypothetical protein
MHLGEGDDMRARGRPVRASAVWSSHGHGEDDARGHSEERRALDRDGRPRCRGPQGGQRRVGGGLSSTGDRARRVEPSNHNGTTDPAAATVIVATLRIRLKLGLRSLALPPDK